jgi:hypothetical protein
MKFRVYLKDPDGPGCYSVAPERCAPGCIDDEMRREREDEQTYGTRDDNGDE